MREPIGLEERFSVTIRYLVTGDIHATIPTSYRIRPTSIGMIIKEATGVIWNLLLKNGYLQQPQACKDW